MIARVIRTAVGDVEFALSEGDGPVVLVSHAGMGGVDQGWLLLDWLDPREYRLLSVSRPGYLRTPLDSGRSVVEQADMFAALLDALGLERVAVITVSSGGPPGYLLAVRHPERVAALVAIASVSGRHTIPETAGPLAQAIFMSQPGQRLMRAVNRRKPAWMLRAMLRSTGLFSKAQLDERVAHVMASPSARQFASSFFDAMFPYRLRSAGTDNDGAQLRDLASLPLDQVRCPALIVHGTLDADVNFHHGVLASEHIPRAERFWIPDGDHLGFWLAPQSSQAQEAARAFLHRCRPW